MAVALCLIGTTMAAGCGGQSAPPPLPDGLKLTQLVGQAVDQASGSKIQIDTSENSCSPATTPGTYVCHLSDQDSNAPAYDITASNGTFTGHFDASESVFGNFFSTVHKSDYPTTVSGAY